VFSFVSISTSGIENGKANSEVSASLTLTVKKTEKYYLLQFLANSGDN